MLSILCDEQERIMTDITLSQQEKQQKVDDLVLDYNGTKCRVNDLGYERFVLVTLVEISYHVLCIAG